MKPEIIDEHPRGTYRIVVDLPDDLPIEMLHEACERVADAVYDWEPKDRNNWDVFVAGGTYDHSTQGYVERLEQRQTEYREILHCIWLYVNWHYVTKQLTTEQKNLWANAIDLCSRADHPGAAAVAERWWE